MACLLRGYDRFTPQVNLDVQSGSGVRWVEVDEEGLKQILLNLGYNALDAMGGTGRLSVRGHAESPGGLEPWEEPRGDPDNIRGDLGITLTNALDSEN